ncbi:MAG: D-alanine--D-alanine ligase [Elusimicrobia bacterium]|nr:D-alanine--D-alanine ligase [Elusimicrobiota bacterium]
MKRKIIAVIFGGRSPEHEVSIESAKTVCAELLKGGFLPKPVYITKRGDWRLANYQVLKRGGKPAGEFIEPSFKEGCFKTESGAKLKPAAVFPIIHGATGEDGKLQGLLELLGMAYVGCGVMASALGMDKIISKKLAADAGAPVLPHIIVRASDKNRIGPKLKKAAGLGFPLFVKPVTLGSSVGIRKVKKAAALKAAVNFAFRYDTAVMIEKGVDYAREIVCGVLGEGAGARASVCGEVRPVGGHEFYDYESKYLDENGMEFNLPAALSKKTAGKLRGLSTAVFAALGCHGMARIDFLMDPKNEKKFYFCEINTVPGFTSHSLYPRLWASTGLAPAETVKKLVELAIKRQAQQSRLSTDRNTGAQAHKSTSKRI